jgi:subtilase family serine protease
VLAINSLAALWLVLSGPAAIKAQRQPSRPRIVDRVDENNLYRLTGNTRPEANATNDRGLVADDLPMDHMLLQLRRSPEQEQAIQQFIDQLHDPQSANFHQWLTAGQIAQRYAPAQEDVDKVTTWLESHGFTVNVVYSGRMLVDFSGTAGQVREALRTEIHRLRVNGQEHIANMSDPQIPAALAPVVGGVVSLHDFMPHTMRKAHPDYTITSSGMASQAVVPADLATIYDFNPLFKSGITGQGQTIAVVEDSDLYSTEDWTTFRSTFGLSKYTSASLTTVHPEPSSGVTNCRAPGVNSDDGEAISDAEWASAAAPSAAIVVASCGNTRATFGGLIAMQNLLESAKPPSIVSISYGECEAENGASSNAAFNTIYQQAVMEGVSVFVAAGDEGAASCDAGASAASHGIGVSAYASTPYNVAVGGTDFGDTFAGTVSTYWNSTNSPIYGSALSYIPEIPWNDSCASSVLATYNGFTATYGTNGFCNSESARQQGLQEVAAGSGGPSGCATGTPSKNGAVSGTCAGYAKPSWQSAAGNPSDAVRDIPDVSLFAADGIWGHFYVTCYSDLRNGGAPCTGPPSNWAGAGGTSFSSPVLAGIQALVNQKHGAQGNPNYVYYKLAAKSGAGAFHGITQGDIDVNCSGTQNCFGATKGNRRGPGGFGHGGSGGGDGALATSSQSDAPAYPAAAGWNFATGLGSIDVGKLVNNWSE